nr:MAG TPA: hypothetical protein [Caudoviricetes sp.]
MTKWPIWPKLCTLHYFAQNNSVIDNSSIYRIEYI